MVSKQISRYGQLKIWSMGVIQLCNVVGYKLYTHGKDINEASMTKLSPVVKL